MITSGTPSRQRWIAAQISISQFATEFNQGFITGIDANTGLISIAGCSLPLRLSDPDGVFGPPAGTKGTPWEFFTADSENPSVSSFSGYPMCIAYAGNVATCPPSNRDGNPVQGTQ